MREKIRIGQKSWEHIKKEEKEHKLDDIMALGNNLIGVIKANQIRDNKKLDSLRFKLEIWKESVLRIKQTNGRTRQRRQRSRRKGQSRNQEDRRQETR